MNTLIGKTQVTKNQIFYGPTGCGKTTSMLYAVAQLFFEKTIDIYACDPYGDIKRTLNNLDFGQRFINSIVYIEPKQVHSYFNGVPNEHNKFIVFLLDDNRGNALENINLLARPEIIVFSTFQTKQGT
jgi:DNA polymerase III delta prime subunit